MPGMTRRPRPLGASLSGADSRQRLRLAQTLLATGPLWLVHLLLLAAWWQGHARAAPVIGYIATTTLGVLIFFALLMRRGLAERLSGDGSLSTPQMVFAMGCIAWGYALAGPLRTALLCLMPVVLAFGIFALEPPAARRLAQLGALMLGVAMSWMVAIDPAGHPPLLEAACWVMLTASMGMIHLLSARLGRLRARLSAQKRELREALQRIGALATRDSLTGLLNRRAAQDELRRLAEDMARSGEPIVVALADLDHFKRVNDNHGHAGGDRVLEAFSRLAAQALRPGDCVARWGGEEFLFVLPGLDEPEAAACLDRLRRSLAATPIDGVPGLAPMSFSAGVSRCRGVDDIQASIERADHSLYAAKRTGRGRTCRAASTETRSTAACEAA